MNPTDQPGQAPTNDTLPAEVREAIGFALSEPPFNLSNNNDEAGDALGVICAALAPLWQKHAEDSAIVDFIGTQDGADWAHYILSKARSAVLSRADLKSAMADVAARAAFNRSEERKDPRP